MRQLPSYAELLERTDAPAGSTWGLFGEDDQLGTLNFLKLADLREAAKEVQSGRGFSLDLLSTAIKNPLTSSRSPIVHNILNRTPFVWDEYLDNFYTQYASQLDGLRHVGHPDCGFYNGFDSDRFVAGDDLLSIHHFAKLPIAGRGVLLDVDRYLKDVGRPIDYHSTWPVSAVDLDATAAAQGTQLRPGDIVLVRFGWMTWYRDVADENTKISLRADPIYPGLEQSHDVMAWLWDNRVSLIAGDNFALECWPAVPSSPFLTQEERDNPAVRVPTTGLMHRAIIPLLGMPIGELWDLDALAEACAEDRRWSFLLTSAPLTLVGGVGSPSNAIALR